MQIVKTKAQMAAEYGVTRKTFVKRLKKAGIIIDGKLVYPAEQDLIYRTLGRPPFLSRNM
ncbi:MAG TPA: hypothetical protein PKC76_08640 [Saprospiraceae bacterium]|nr:hypothetical protein [Saprospiraceae bacterium]HMP24185.1 hypothetical protein [Saprospiraceae bacterium]